MPLLAMDMHGLKKHYIVTLTYKIGGTDRRIEEGKGNFSHLHVQYIK